MKFVILAFTIAAAAAQASDWKEKARYMQAKYEEARDTCATKHGLTEEQVKALEAMQQPATKDDKCVLECVLTETGLMKSGKFFRDGSDKIAQYLYDDDVDGLNLAMSVSKRCEKAVEAAKLDDGCETAAEVLRCLSMTAKQLSTKAEIYE